MTDDVDADADLAALQRRQFGAFSRRQALDLKVPASTLDHRLKQGRYQRLLPGVWSDRVVPDSWERRAMAALLAAGGEAVLARQSAARVLELDVPASLEDGRLHVLVTVRTFEALEGLVVHRTRRLDPEKDVRSLGALTVTTATRTIVDLAGTLGPVALRRLVADAVRRDLVSATSLREACSRLGRVRGKRRLLALVDELSPLDGDCRSELETLFLRLMTSSGLPPTAMNHPVTDADGRRRLLDAVYLPERLPIELDSRSAHGSLLDWHDDLRRENAVVLTGWRDFLRFSWDDVTRRPGRVVDTVRTALDAARAPRS